MCTLLITLKNLRHKDSVYKTFVDDGNGHKFSYKFEEIKLVRDYTISVKMQTISTDYTSIKKEVLSK